MHFRTRAELEGRMEAARQLRAETLGGVRWIVVAIVGAALFVRRMLHARTTDIIRGA
jgi:hypothetical protein